MIFRQAKLAAQHTARTKNEQWKREGGGFSLSTRLPHAHARSRTCNTNFCLKCLRCLTRLKCLSVSGIP
jgi:hypothetical protein